MKRVLLIGTIPPPIGGVSMHLQRFFDKYAKDDEYYIDVLDLKKKESLRDKKKLSFIKLFLFIVSFQVIHLHVSNNLKIMVAILSKLLGKKVVYTHHNIRIDNYFLFKIFMMFVDELILVNDKDISDKVKQYDYQLIPAFLPSTDETPLPLELSEQLSKFEMILSTNCFQMTFIDNKDLYGFDLCVSAFSSLVNKGLVENTALVLVDPSDTSKEYVDELLKTFSPQNGCEIIYVGYSINFNILAEASDIVFRATRSDGDSLTVREALWIGTPIIASDVTLRPEGTICFKHEDSEDLETKTIETLNTKVDNSSRHLEMDYGKLVIETYGKILNK
jgi:glycosyltransferase involved in cell wall biosynthesis